MSADYALLLEQLRSLIGAERDLVSGLANASALIMDGVSELNWAGFYLPRADGSLILGPFQGKPACVVIPKGHGVCGAAAAMGHSVLVADVHSFPGHIACDAASRSELVVPLFANDRLAAVLDLDSPRAARFTTLDQSGVESLARFLESALDFSARG